MHWQVILLTLLPQLWCFSLNPPLFLGSNVEKQNDHEWLITGSAGDQIECKFRRDPIRFQKAANGSVSVVIEPKVDAAKDGVRLTFNQIIAGNETSSPKNKTLIDQPVEFSFIKYHITGKQVPESNYILEGSIKINTLELSFKSHNQVYSCCVEERTKSRNSSTQSCAFIRFGHGASHDHMAAATLDADLFSYYKVLYRVIIVLLVTIFVLMMVMLVVCIRLSDEHHGLWSGRRPRAAIRTPSSPQLFTVSVPGQASMPKLNLVGSRGDLYDRYNLNPNVSIVDETLNDEVETSVDGCPPPPPYTEYPVRQFDSK